MKWLSYNCKEFGFRYAVCVSISDELAVWAHGPFPGGKYSDLWMFKMGMARMLPKGETIVAGGTYKHEKCILRTGLEESDKLIQKIRARHETLNRLINAFRCLWSTSRHPLHRHKSVSLAVVNLVQV